MSFSISIFSLEANFRDYLAILSAVFFSGLLFVVSVGYVVDPGNLFRPPDYEKGIGEIMLAGKNVGNVVDFNDRLLQRYLVEEMVTVPQVVALGSSRVLGIRSGMFPGKVFFNHGLMSGTLQDLVALLELYRQRGDIPAMVVLGLDPWMLNRNTKQRRWRVLHQEVSSFLAFMELSSGVRVDSLGWAKWRELASLVYLRRSLADLFRQDKATDFFATTSLADTVRIRLADGSSVYETKIRALSEEAVGESAVAFASREPVPTLEGFFELDSWSMSVTEAIVSYLQSRGVEVAIYLPPYHPSAYELLEHKDSTQQVLAAEEYFKSLSAKFSIGLVGSYDPNKAGCRASEFYDAAHAKESCVSRILKPLGESL